MKKILFFLLVFLVIFSSCQKQKNVENEKVLILRYADNQPDFFPTTKAAKYFAELVYARSGGKIDIHVYANGDLGDEMQCYRQVQFGGIDFSRFSLGTLSAYYPKLNLLMLPYLYTDAEHMWRVLDSEIGDEFLGEVREDGMSGLCWFDAGARSFYTRMPIDSLDDMRGLMIRVQENDIMSRMVSSLGSETVQIPYGSVYSALQVGKIDGAENNMPSYLYTGHYESSPYVFLDEHFRLPEMVVMSRSAKKQIEEIGPEFVEIVRECARESAAYERRLWKEEEQNAISTLKKMGVAITIPTDEEKENFKAAMSVIYNELSEENTKLVESIRNK